MTPTLLTPNRQSRLPGFKYKGDDPDGFMTMQELIQFIEDCANKVNPPLKTKTEVTDVRQNGKGYKVTSTEGEWTCRALVIASGPCNILSIPKCGQDLPRDITSLTPHDYRNPDQLEPGGVMIVGASATGLQLADEIQQQAHEITVSTGEHVRMPRTYRGRDIQFWLHKAGILDERYDEVDDINRARKLPSPQLIGAHDPKILDFNKLIAQGARLVGRIMGIRDGKAMYSGSLKNVCALADLKMNRMLNSIDEWADEYQNQSPEECKQETKERFELTKVDEKPTNTIDFNDANIKTIIWCTGFRPDYKYLKVDTFDHKGMIKRDGGVANSPGLYVIGLPVLRRRKSSFIHGTEDDVNDITKHLVGFLSSKPETRTGATQ